MENIKIDGLAYFSEKKFKEEQQEWEKYRFASKNYPRVGKSEAVMWDIICTAFGWPKPEWTFQEVSIEDL